MAENFKACPLLTMAKVIGLASGQGKVTFDYACNKCMGENCQWWHDDVCDVSKIACIADRMPNGGNYSGF